MCCFLKPAYSARNSGVSSGCIEWAAGFFVSSFMTSSRCCGSSGCVMLIGRRGGAEGRNGVERREDPRDSWPTIQRDVETAIVPEVRQPRLVAMTVCACGRIARELDLERIKGQIYPMDKPFVLPGCFCSELL